MHWNRNRNLHGRSVYKCAQKARWAHRMHTWQQQCQPKWCDSPLVITLHALRIQVRNILIQSRNVSIYINEMRQWFVATHWMCVCVVRACNHMSDNRISCQFHRCRNKQSMISFLGRQFPVHMHNNTRSHINPWELQKQSQGIAFVSRKVSGAIVTSLMISRGILFCTL